MMLDLIEKFPDNIKEAIDISNKIELNVASKKTYNNVFICGMGGSGIAGSIIKSYAYNECNSTIPIITHKNYEIPYFINQDSLVIIVSYSGNTEEMLVCQMNARKKGINSIVISSGGGIEPANQNETTYVYDYIRIPGGNPPRTALAYSLVILFNILSKLDILRVNLEQINQIPDFLLKYNNDIKIKSAELADNIVKSGFSPVIYCDTELDAVALRWKQQINENANEWCWYNVIPEMNHNEIVAFSEHSTYEFIILKSSLIGYSMNRKRATYIQEFLEELNNTVYEIEAIGENYFEHLFYLINFGDYLSYYMAEYKGVDPMEILLIDKLKIKLL
jgi:glucose/mannose-6-phosphate isomerase